MWLRNLKYVKGNPPVDNWQEIPERVAKGLLAWFEKYAEESGFTVSSYMEFIRENVVKEA